MFTFKLIFFIPLRKAEAITSGNFLSAKRDPGSTKEESHLAGMKIFTGNRSTKSLQHCWNPCKTGQNFIPANRDYVITTSKFITIITIIYYYLKKDKFFEASYIKICCGKIEVTIKINTFKISYVHT